MASLHIFNVAGRLGYKLSVRISPDYSGLLICPEFLGLITLDTGRTELITIEFGLGLTTMGIIVGFVFWKIGSHKDYEDKCTYIFYIDQPDINRLSKYCNR